GRDQLQRSAARESDVPNFGLENPAMMLSARIGAIEFDEQEVRLAVVKTGGRRPVVLERHREPVTFAEPAQRAEAFVQAVQALVARTKSKPSAYVLCASSR